MQRGNSDSVYVGFLLIVAVVLRVSQAWDIQQGNSSLVAKAAPESLQGYITSMPPEPAEHRKARHERIAQRRAGAENTAEDD